MVFKNVMSSVALSFAVPAFLSASAMAQTQLSAQGIVLSSLCPSSLAKGHAISTVAARGTGIGKNFVLTKLDVVGTVQESTAPATLPIACFTSKSGLGAVSPVYPIVIKRHARAFSLRAFIDIKSAARAKGILNGNQKVIFTLQNTYSSTLNKGGKSVLYSHTENDAPFDLFGSADNGSSMLMSTISFNGKSVDLLPGNHYLNIQVVDTKTGFGEVVYRGTVRVE